MTCELWTDHEWDTQRLVESGKHPLMGTFQKFLATCRRCGRETTETRWTDLTHVASRDVPQGGMTEGG